MKKRKFVQMQQILLVLLLIIHHQKSGVHAQAKENEKILKTLLLNIME